MKQHSPAAMRNREPIAEVLAEELPSGGTVLEIASGTGEHAAYFSARFPALEWQPSDPDESALASIAAWRAECGLSNLLPPVKLDAAQSAWPISRAAAIFCCNMVHISPISATEGLLRGAERMLKVGEPLIFYGPFMEDGVITEPSNLAFDADLKRRNPAWGLRRLEWLDMLAENQKLARTRWVAMPANNLMLIYRKQPEPPSAGSPGG